MRGAGVAAVPRRRPLARRAFVAELEAKHNHYVAARADDKLVGYGGISRLGRKPPYEYEIHTIGVDPAYQGHGVGRRLLDELLDYRQRRRVLLEVRTDNEPAIALYQSVDFARSACADGTTASAAPTPTPCDGRRSHDDNHPGHRKLLRRNRSRHRPTRWQRRGDAAGRRGRL